METLTIPALATKIPNEAAAYRWLERLRWKGRPVCPRCGVIGGHWLVKAKRTTTTGKVSKRRLWKCSACRKQFSVLVGTIFHGSHIPVRTWLFVLAEMVASKNGIAAREIQRKYGVTAKSAWFMAHRIREAMTDKRPDMLVGTIIADETWIGGESRPAPFSVEPSQRHKYAADHRMDNKVSVMSILCRESGEVRSRVVPNVTGDMLARVLRANVNIPGSVLYTDEWRGYRKVGREFRAHERVNHSDGEYVRGDVTTNPVESYFGQLKRSVDGTFHHVSREHLDRYLAEFDFRHSTRLLSDSARLDRLIDQCRGKRLMYRPMTQAA